MRLAVVLLATLLTSLLGRPAHATPVGTASGAFQFISGDPNNFAVPVVVNGSYDFNDATFGSFPNLGTELGRLTFQTTASFLTSIFTTAQQTFPDPNVFALETTGFFSPSAFGVAGSFVADIDPNSVTGTFSLPAGFVYTFDGFFDPNIPVDPNDHVDPNGNTLNPLASLFGVVFGLNAFEPVATGTGSNVTIDPNTTFFNPVTGEEVILSVEITFDTVSTAGETVVKAISNAAGEVPANFQIEVGGVPIGAFLDISTTAVVSGPIIICIHYPDSNPNDGIVDGTGVPECELRILHQDPNGNFNQEVTLLAVESDCPVPLDNLCDPAPIQYCIDEVNDEICARVSNLSLFVFARELTSVPILPPWALILLGSLFLSTGWLVVRRRGLTRT